MSSRWMLLSFAASTLIASSAFAVPKTTCDLATQFFHSQAYQCRSTGQDCSRDECVNTAFCRYIEGYSGYTFVFSYPIDCDPSKN